MNPASLPDSTPLTDAQIQAIFHRAMRLVAILGFAVAAILTVAMGWQTGLLFMVGAAISFTGIREWRNLTTAVFDRIGTGTSSKPAGRTVVMFFLRLALAGLALYASLRCLHGSVYALVAGLGLAVIALSVEALRLLRA